MWTWLRRTAPEPCWAIRSRPTRCWPLTVAVGRCHCGWARSSRTSATPGRGRGGRSDQDGAGDAARPVAPTLNVDEPTPHVDWSQGGVELLTEAMDWPVLDRPRRSGVSSFGVSGTNAHVILEQAPDQPEPEPSTGAVPFVLSARDDAALRTQRGPAAPATPHRPGAAAALARALATTRAAHEHRAAIVTDDLADLIPASTPSPRTGPSPRIDARHRARSGQGRVRLSRSGLAMGRHGHRAARRIAGIPRAVRGMRRRARPAHRLRAGRGAGRSGPARPDRRGAGAAVGGARVAWPTSGSTRACSRTRWSAPARARSRRPPSPGALGLDDAARLIALRSRLFVERLAGHGGMASIPSRRRRIALARPERR